jgi:hypothetical protein
MSLSEETESPLTLSMTDDVGSDGIPIDEDQNILPNTFHEEINENMLNPNDNILLKDVAIENLSYPPNDDDSTQALHGDDSSQATSLMNGPLAETVVKNVSIPPPKISCTRAEWISDIHVIR